VHEKPADQCPHAESNSDCGVEMFVHGKVGSLCSFDGPVSKVFETSFSLVERDRETLACFDNLFFGGTARCVEQGSSVVSEGGKIISYGLGVLIHIS
jgi:hypothetical protein